ncbi:hypothetical protein [Ferruginibacter sp.]
MNSFSFTIDAAFKKLQTETDKKFTVVLQHGSMQIKYFAPKIQIHNCHTYRMKFMLLLQAIPIFSEMGKHQL